MIRGYMEVLAWMADRVFPYPYHEGEYLLAS